MPILVYKAAEQSLDAAARGGGCRRPSVIALGITRDGGVACTHLYHCFFFTETENEFLTVLSKSTAAPLPVAFLPSSGLCARAPSGRRPQEERYNRRLVLADGRTVSYAVAGSPDGLPVFLFLV